MPRELMPRWGLYSSGFTLRILSKSRSISAFRGFMLMTMGATYAAEMPRETDISRFSPIYATSIALMMPLQRWSHTYFAYFIPNVLHIYLAGILGHWGWRR